MKFLKLIPVILASFFVLPSALGQEINIIKDSLFSKILNEQRNIQVVLPKEYKENSKEKFDVLFILDEGNTKNISFIQRYLQGEFVPPMILVGINNIDRNRDFLPTLSKTIKTSGGAGSFLSFLENELIPFFNKKYPSSGDISLFGHSFGGVFATYAFLKKPSVFSNYLIVDPSYWWDNQYLVKMAKQKIDSISGQEHTVFISGREGQPYSEMGITAMDSVLKKVNNNGLRIKSIAYPNETHGSVILKTVYDGLKYFYEGYNAHINFHPMSGILLKNLPTKIWSFDSVENIFYTTDGSIPTIKSIPLKNEIEITGPVVLKVKPGTKVKNAKVVSGKFEIGNYLKPLAKLKNAKKGGFDYAYYEGEWDSLPDFKKLKPKKTGIADKNFNIDQLPLKSNFACLFEGHIEIQRDGYYVFGVQSDDGSKFYIDGKLILNNDGLHDSSNPVSYILPLKKGFYPVKLEYFQKGGGASLNLLYILPDTGPKPINIPFELQYGKDK